MLPGSYFLGCPEPAGEPEPEPEAEDVKLEPEGEGEAEPEAELEAEEAEEDDGIMIDDMEVEPEGGLEELADEDLEELAEDEEEDGEEGSQIAAPIGLEVVDGDESGADAGTLEMLFTQVRPQGMADFLVLKHCLSSLKRCISLRSCRPATIRTGWTSGRRTSAT